MVAMHTIFLADDHPLFRQALRSALESVLNCPQWCEAGDAGQLQQLLENRSYDADLLLLDLMIPGAHGFSTLIHVRQHFPTVPVIVVSGHDDAETIRQSIHFGASGFMPKSLAPEQMREAVLRVLDGQFWVPDPEVLDKPCDQGIGERLAQLTPQQYRILMMFAEGLLNKQIAYELNVSEATIKAHATAIFRKLGVRNRTQAVIALGQLETEGRSSLLE